MRRRFATALAISLSLTEPPACAEDAAERAYSRGDYARAASLLIPEAGSGRAVAQSFLGYQYQNGLGLPKSVEEAAYWFSRAAEQGKPNARFFLGLLYDRGQGVPEDPVEAEKWLDLAALRAPSDRRDYWASMRDIVGGKMTPAELGEARRRAVAFRPVRER